VNFGERGKSSGRHSLTSTVKPILTVSLATGPLRVCVGLVKGLIRVHWQGFRGGDPGWPRFDRCLTGLTRLIRSLALMTVIKNLGRHTPELNRSGIQENVHLEGIRGPHAKAEPSRGLPQADRPCGESDRAPPSPNQALLREGSSTAS
jgi:hypothetical protein